MSFCPQCGARWRAPPEGPDARCPLDGTELGRAAGGRDPADPLIGRRLGAYQVVAPLAEGKTSRLFTAQTEDGREVVLKVLDGELCHDPDRAARYASAATLAELRDPEFFVRVLGSATSEHGLISVAMERFHGQTLEARLAAGPIDEGEAAEIAAGIAEALATLHRRARGYGALEARKVLLERLGEPPHLRVRLLDASAARALLPPLTPPPGPDEDMRALGALIRRLVPGPADAPLLQLAPRLEAPTEAKGLAHADAFLTALNKRGSGVVLSRPPTPAAEPGQTASERPARAPSLRPRAASVVPTVKRGPGVGRVLIAGLAAAIFVITFVAITRPKPEPTREGMAPPVSPVPSEPLAIEAPAPREPEAELDPPPPAPAVKAEPSPQPAAARPESAAADEARFLELDAQLGVALSARGLNFEDLSAVESRRARQWGRWFRKLDRPRREDLEATYAALVAAIDRASEAKQAKLRKEKAAARARPPAPVEAARTSTRTSG